MDDNDQTDLKNQYPEPPKLSRPIFVCIDGINPIRELTNPELKESLAKAVDAEQYEIAAKLKLAIRRIREIF